jgi:hypothetical protein
MGRDGILDLTASDSHQPLSPPQVVPRFRRRPNPPYARRADLDVFPQESRLPSVCPPDKVPLIVPALTAPGGSLFPRNGMSRPTASPQEERHSFASAGGGRTLTSLPVRGGSLDGSAEGVATRMASGRRPTGGGCSGGASAGSSTNHPEHHVLIDAIVVAISLLQDGFVGLQLFDGISPRSSPMTV